MTGFSAIVNKEIKSVLKEKTIVFAIVIQLLIAAFSSVILIGLMSFYDPGSIGQNTNIHFDVGLVGEGNSGPLASYLTDAGLTVIPIASADDAVSQMRSGDLDAVLVIPNSTGVVNMQLYLPESDSTSTVELMVMESPLEKYEDYLREQNGVHVMYTQMQGLSSTTFEFLYSFIIPMLMFFPAFIAGSMIIDSISEEVENKTLDTLMTSPISLNTVLFGKVAASVILAIIQCVAWVLLLSVNHLYIQNAVLVLLLAFIVAAFVTLGSAVISMYFKDRERSQFVYSILLMTVGGICLFANPSPISVMTRLATGDPHVGVLDVSIFILPLAALAIIFYYASKKLLAYKA